MTLTSMTGFARADGSDAGASWHWELRSVNGRGLDLRLRLPPGHDALEPKVREQAQKRLTRGNVSLSLSMQIENGRQVVRLNETVLGQVLTAAERVRALTGGEPASVSSLLSIRGVLEVIEETETPEVAEARHAAVLETLEAALAALNTARAEEGARLARVLAAHVDEAERLVGMIESAPARSVETIRARLRQQVSRLMEEVAGLDPQRLHQEAVLLATRADVEEEIKRLRSHIAAARDLFATAGTVGRRFDFLAQEFNREANTLCSKANDETVTQAGLALKVVIDQMREQVQNIE
ncbi:MAG: YicC/YloC family endoribonuclease [Hyphomicrobiaceae bacterium]|nr:YicC/YloC family endoribonuclease [Hyphomicrobiaceae bacterium]